MAIGDFFVYLNNNAGAYTSFVPVGTAIFMEISLGAGSTGATYSYDGAVQSLTAYFGGSGLMTYNADNCKIIYTNTNYCRIYAANQVNVCFVEVA